MADALEFKQVGTLRDHYKHGVPVIQIRGPYGGPVLFYQCPLNVDWDGSSTAYGVDRPGKDFPLQKGLQPHEWGQDGLFGSGKGSDGSWAGVYSATEAEARNFLPPTPNLETMPKHGWPCYRNFSTPVSRTSTDDFRWCRLSTTIPSKRDITSRNAQLRPIPPPSYGISIVIMTPRTLRMARFRTGS